jgi:type IV fimbrial biogenesis protein FimT
MQFDPLNKAAGFTLFELVVTMGIAAVLAAIAIPSFQYVTNSNRIAAEGNALLGDLQFARAEAIKEGQTVTACVSNPLGTACAGGTAWQSGWIVFSDLGNNQTLGGNDVVLRKQPPFSGSDTFTASNGITAISFGREGFTTNVAGGTLVTLHTTPVSSSATRCLSITLIGMMTILPFGSVDSANGNATCT